MSKGKISSNRLVQKTPYKNSLTRHDLRDENFLASNVLFSCSCGGALVQTAICLVCKRSSSRFCLSCGAVKEFGSHEACLGLISMTYKSTQKNSIKNEAQC